MKRGTAYQNVQVLWPGREVEEAAFARLDDAVGIWGEEGVGKEEQDMRHGQHPTSTQCMAKQRARANTHTSCTVIEEGEIAALEVSPPGVEIQES